MSLDGMDPLRVDGDLGVLDPALLSTPVTIEQERTKIGIFIQGTHSRILKRSQLLRTRGDVVQSVDIPRDVPRDSNAGVDIIDRVQNHPGVLSYSSEEWEKEQNRITELHASERKLLGVTKDNIEEPHRLSVSSVASSQFATNSRRPNDQRRSDEGYASEFNRLSSGASSEFQGNLGHYHLLEYKQQGEHQYEEVRSPGNSQLYNRLPELRISHKLAERKRRTEMKELYDELRDLMPQELGSKGSKWEILRKAITEHKRQDEYIRQLELQSRTATAETQRIRDEFMQVKAENRDLHLRQESNTVLKNEDRDKYIVQDSENAFDFRRRMNSRHDEDKEIGSERNEQQDLAHKNQLFMQRQGLPNESTALPMAELGELMSSTRDLLITEQPPTSSCPYIDLSQVKVLYKPFSPEITPEAKTAVKIAKLACNQNRAELVRNGMFETDISDENGSQVKDAETEEAEESSFTDEEGYWSSIEDLSLQRPFLNKYQRQSAEEAMETFWSLMNQHWRAIIRERTEKNSDDTAPTRSDPTVVGLGATTTPEYVSQTSLGKHKASSGDRGSDDRQPKRNREETRFPDDATEKPQYACPYRKHSRLRYNVHTHRTCALSWFPTIARVKEHLYRTHRAPIQCPRCSLQLEDHSALKTHLKAKTVCEDIDGEPVEGFDFDVEVKLKRRKKTSRDQTDFERWQDIYQILFPENEEVPSPYFEAPKDEPPPPSIPIEEYIRHEVPRRVRQQIEDHFASKEGSTLLQHLSSNIMGILEREIDACVMAHRTMVAEMDKMSSSGTPPLSSLQSTSIIQTASSVSSHAVSRTSPSDSSCTTFDLNQPLKSGEDSDRMLPIPVLNPGYLSHHPHSSQPLLEGELDPPFPFLPSSSTFVSQLPEDQMDKQIQESWSSMMWLSDDTYGFKGNEDPKAGGTPWCWPGLPQ